MIRRTSTLILLVALLGAPRAHAQGIPVYDDANFLVSLAQVAQLILGVVEAVTQTAQGVQNLLPLDEIVAAEGIAEDMQALGRILEDAEGLMQDIQMLQAIFDPRTAPSTFPALQLRISEMDEAIRKARSYAMKTQLLIFTVGRTITHLTGLVNGIAALVGNKQAQQQLIQVNATVSKTLVVLTTQTASAQRDQTLTGMREEVIRTSLAKINAARWEGWPGYAGGQ